MTADGVKIRLTVHQNATVPFGHLVIDLLKFRHTAHRISVQVACEQVVLIRLVPCPSVFQKLGQAIVCLGKAALPRNQRPIGAPGRRRDRPLPFASRPENPVRTSRARIAARPRAGTSDSARTPCHCPAVRSTRAAIRFARRRRRSPPAVGESQPGARCTPSACKPARQPAPGARTAAAESRPWPHSPFAGSDRTAEKTPRLARQTHSRPSVGRRQGSAACREWNPRDSRSRCGRNRSRRSPAGASAGPAGLAAPQASDPTKPAPEG